LTVVKGHHGIGEFLGRLVALPSDNHTIARTGGGEGAADSFAAISNELHGRQGT
jgi:hypothetical protein